MTPGLPENVLRYLQEELPASLLQDYQLEEVKSAQQKVWIVTFTPPTSSMSDLAWSKSLQTGRYRLVVRLWKGSARWWNLNNNQAPSLASAEVSAYQIAKQALPHLVMPTLLHFEEQSGSMYPWAIFSYVGQHSCYYNDTDRIHTLEWVEGMVKIRPEFGFAEPHPRWGRVPVEQALDYTLMVLHSIAIPLHKHLSQHEDQNWSSLATEEGQAWTYSGMCSVYEAELARISSILSSSECGLADSRLQRLVNVLRTCVDKMQEEEISNASPVLVHMDCQPQNLLMYSSPDKDSHIASVLDWEEAAYADPRFELLLLGRKVCANREQANVVWNTYQDEMNIQLGSIEPWLRLETVHSITTLVLQSMNLVGGGRSPWETKPDLWGKIERELHRLCGLGWNFCRSVILQ